MSADKRTPHTDALDTLGMIHEYDEHRDAIHLGVEPIEAGETLKAGQHIGIGSDGKAYIAVESYIKAVGIVDPFLTTIVKQGERFWLVVYPRAITSLRHVWEHPDFPITNETRPKELTKEQQETVDMIRNTPAHRARQEIEAFAESISSEEDSDWFRGITVSADELIDKMLEVGTSKSEWLSDYWSNGSQFEGVYIPDNIWDAVETIKNVKLDNRESFFSCSC